TVSVVDAGGTYNGSPFAATATVAGASGGPGAGLEGGSPSLTDYAGGRGTGPPPPRGPPPLGTSTALGGFARSIDYVGASAQTTFTIAQAPLTVNVGSLSKTYGDTVNLAAALGTSYATGVNGEALGIAYSSAGAAAAAHVQTGGYPITATLA